MATNHEHDWRRDPFFLSQTGAGTPYERRVCALCHLMQVVPTSANPTAVTTWPKVNP